MTNKEAIKQLAEIGTILQIIPSSKKGQALSMAIDALKKTDYSDNDIRDFDSNDRIRTEIIHLVAKR